MAPFKKKEEKKGKEESVSKQDLFKGCYQGQIVAVLAILERIQFKNFSYQLTMEAEKTFQRSRHFGGALNPNF